VNPVMSEAMMMLCAQVMGNHLAVTIGGQHGNFELNVMMPVMAHNFLQSVAILSNGCDAFRANAVDGIGANRERCRELLEKNPAIATALNAYIGYDEAAAVAKESARNSESVRTVVKRRGLLSDEQLDTVLNVREMTEPGIPGGGVVGGGGG
jgi:fumarate hydratase class II